MLLYAALIQREFGTKREHLSLARRPSLFDFFSRFSSLLPLLLSELGRASSGEAAAEGLGSVFSVLLLLSLLQSPSADSHWSRPFETYVEKCRKSKVWKVREAAAAALTGLVPPSRTWTTCGAILTTIQEEGDTNAVSFAVPGCRQRGPKLTALRDTATWKPVAAVSARQDRLYSCS